MNRAIKNIFAGVVLSVVTTAQIALAVPPPAGIAPVGPPPGGFSIEGDLLANTPVVDIGDWMLNTNLANGTGLGVLTMNGVAIDASRTFRFVDPFNNSSTDRIFSGGAKWTDDPRTWTWTSGKPSSKTDINNAMMHLSTDTNGHIWVILAADRYSTSGDSYIDFELLQSPLTKNANGTFSSGGTNHGGRTVNDLLLSIAFTGGGKVADFIASRWTPSGSGYAYTNITAMLPAGDVFVAMNSNTIAAPYGAFGSTSYAPNAFGEAAVDLTALLGNFNPCESFGFKTIMIKTKASASTSASIEDFIDPIQYNLNIGPGANAGPDQVRCTEGATTAFALNGAATSGLQPVATTTWSVISGDVTIADPASPTTTANVSSASATLRLTVVLVNGCAKTDDIVLSVQQPPVANIAGPTTLCPRTTNTFSAPASDMSGYAWSISGNGSIAGAATAQTVKVVAGSNCGQPFTLTLSIRSNVCSVVIASEVLVTDSGAPVLVLPPNRILDCQASTATNATGVATATDTCSRVTVTYSDAVTNGCGVSKTITRTWLATDECGNAVSGAQNIVVQDITPPVLVRPADRTVECSADSSPAATGMATATDMCGSAQVSYTDSETPACGATKVIARRWTAIDLCGNTATATQTITVRDTVAPVLTIPQNVTLEAPANSSPNATGTATATDVCGTPLISYTDSTVTNCGSTMVITRIWRATDECGNFTNRSQIITVRDTTPPVIVCVPDRTLEYPAVTTTNATGVATATDAASSTVITYTDSTTNSCGSTKTITRRWTATDACGNSASCTQLITVRDTTPPALIIPTNRFVECSQPTTTNLTGVATATDANGTSVITFTDSATNSCGATLTIARRWTATDVCGNATNGIQLITVRDTLPPVLVRPADRTVECSADSSPAATGMASATDQCGSAQVSYTDSETPACGATKVIARRWTAIDLCGNTATATQTITVRDTVAPVLTIPQNVTLEAPANSSPNATGTATATDVCGTPLISYTDSTVTNCGSTMVITRIWRATDECGNFTNRSQIITVRDTTPPVIVCVPDRTLEYPAVTTTNATGVATATDAASSTVITYTDSTTNSCGSTKTITRRWTATDACGNSASCTQLITVRDTTPPALIIPTNRFVECSQPTTTNLTGVATATDANGTSVITFTDSATNSCGATLTIARRWTATDVCGNATNGIQLITVLDTIPPVIFCPASLTFEAPAVTTTNLTGVATATDACSTAAVTYTDSVATNCGLAKVISRTWRATDQCGNTSTCVQTIAVVDTKLPVLTIPTNRIVECGGSTAPSATGLATATDTASTPVVTYTDALTPLCGETKLINRTWTATDACGNKTNALQLITVRDTTPPNLTVPANVTQEAPGDTRTSVTGMATAFDGCGTVVVSYSETVTNGCGFTRTVRRLWTAVDQCGNSTNALQIITVVDTRSPRVTLPNIAVQCADDVPAAYASLAELLAAGGTVTDNSTNTLGFALVSDSGLVGSCPGAVTRVYRVTDDCGNFTNATHRITVDDTMAPIVTCPPSMTVACGDSMNPTTTGFATATDNCSTNLNITYTDTDATLTTSSYNLNWYASDPAPDSAPYLPTYMKFGPGDLPCPTNGRAADPLRNAVAFGPTAGQLDALTSLGGQPFVLGQIVPFQAVIEVAGGRGPEKGTIEFTATWATHTTSNDKFGYDKNYKVLCAFVDSADVGSVDPHFNAKVDSFTASVVNPDTNEENIQGTFRVSGLDSGDRIVVEIWVVLMSEQPDHVGGTIAAQMVLANKLTSPVTPISMGAKTISIGSLNKLDQLPQPQSQPPLPPQPEPPTVLPGFVTSVIDRTWKATDTCGNTGTCTQRFNVLDGAAPILTVPANVVLEAPSTAGTNVTGVAVALDTCGAAALSYSDTVSNLCGITKVISRRWTAIDEFGHSTNAVQTISVVDTTAPSMVAPADMVRESSTATGTNVCGTAVGQDLSGLVTVSYSDAVSNLCGISKVITRRWTATDACGNSANAVQTISVVDTTAPTLVLPANMVRECPAATGTNVCGMAAASDLSGFVAVSYSDTVSNSCGASQVINRRWTATDACGNSTNAVQTISVVDTTSPSLVAPADMVRECPSATGTNVCGTAAAQDLSGFVTVSYSDTVSNSCGISQVITRRWTATDACGNSTNAFQTISVVDTTPPTLTTCTNKTIAAGQPLVFDAPTATDASGICVVTVVSTTTNASPNGSYTVARTWCATDACGNMCPGTAQTITVAAPIVVVPALDRLTISAKSGGILLRWPTNAANYRLESAATMSSRWTPVRVTPVSTNGEYQVTLPMNAPSQLFRLSDGAPLLELSVAGGNLRLSWPTAPSGFQIESSATMAPGSWTPVLATPVISNAFNYANVPITPGTSKIFFRLKK